MSKKIEKLEEDELYADEHNEVPPPDIVAYNELRSCADLVRMHGDGILDIQPDFQRDLVWSARDQTRFVDSITKQLPIPSMCFAFDFRLNKWQVIDGLQRISTIVKFLNGEDWKLSKLDDIDPNLAGANAEDIKDSTSGPLHQLYLRVQNQALPINVLRCDFKKKRHTEYLFTIFHRLNSGGVRLNNQEIRNCIYGGSFNQLLRDLDNFPAWRKINNMRAGEKHRFTKQELILRFFAFFDNADEYNGQISRFLNDYMFEHREAEEPFLAEKRTLFERTVNVIRKKIFNKTTPPRLPVTIIEAVMVGVADNLDALEVMRVRDVVQRYKEFREHGSISEASLSEGLSKKDKVEDRLAAARRIFGR